MVSHGAIQNPFADTIVKDPWSEPIDVVAINALVSRTILDELALVRATGDSRGVVVVGQAGTGKTHLLARLRRDLAQSATGCLAHLPPLVGDPAGFARHVLHHLVASLTRPPRSQLLDLFHSFIVRGVLHVQGRPVHVDRARLRELTADAQALVHDAAPTADPDVVAALAASVRGEAARARRWLLGEELPAADLERLELTRSIASEDDALRAIESIAAIAQLASPRRVLVLAFDQVDAYVDAARRQRFAEVAAELIHRPGHLVVTMCLIATWQEIERDVKTPLVQRLSRGGLPPLEMRALTPDEIALVIEQRLQHAFGAGPRPSPRQLFGAADLAALAALAPGRVPARAVLNEARLRFAEWQERAPGPEPEPGRPLLARARQALEQHGLPVADAREPFDLVVRGERGIGIAVLDALDGHAWRRLARIESREAATDEAAIDHAVLVHARGLRPGAHSVKTRELLKRLRRGARSHVVEIDHDCQELVDVVQSRLGGRDAATTSETLEQRIAALLAGGRAMNLGKLRAALPASITEAATLAAVEQLAKRGAVTCRQYHDELEVRLHQE